MGGVTTKNNSVSVVCVVRFVTTLGLCDIHPWRHSPNPPLPIAVPPVWKLNSMVRSNIQQRHVTRLHKIVFSLVTETVLLGFSPILCFCFHPLLVTQSHDRASSALYSGPNLFVKWTQNLCVCIPTATRCRSWQWEYKHTRSMPISLANRTRNTKHSL